MLCARDVFEAIGGRLVGDGDLKLEDVRGLSEAGPNHVSFLSNSRYLSQVTASRAGLLLLPEGTEVTGRTCIYLDDPYAGFAKALRLFHPTDWPEASVSDRASVSESAILGEGVVVEPFATIAEGAKIGPGSWIQAGAYVGRGSILGASCRLMPSAVVMDGAKLGDRVWLNPGAVIGAEGFGFAPTSDRPIKIPQVGGVVIGDDVELGANSCVDRGALSSTIVGTGTKFDNLTQVGHGAKVGEDGLFVAFTGIAGSAVVGDHVTMAVRSTVVGHIEVEDGVTVAAHSLVSKTVKRGASIAGVPAQDHREWRKQVALGRTTADLLKRIEILEKRLLAIEGDE
jgi:UDP-3-O-[3-hydroxymyristoyl] glucosamine N-acyltransferase